MQKVLEIAIIALLIGAFATFDINHMYTSVGCAWTAFVLFIGLTGVIEKKEAEE